jgi:D-serine dehydratase
VVAIPAMKRSLEQKFGQPISGELLLKKTAICRFPARSRRAAAFMKC